MAKLILEGHWDPNWHLLHSTYDPLPMDLGLFGTVSMVTSIPYISQLNNWAIYLPFIIAYDLVLYSLTKRVTDSRVAGVIAIFILASTPPANIISHGTKWIGNMFVLISALALIKAFDGPSSISNITVANLSYGAAILFHPSSVIGVFLPLGVVVVSYLANQAVKRKVWTKLFRSRLFRMTFILFTVITLTRGLYTAGYLEDVLPALKNFALTAFGYSTPIESYTPVYEQAVSPVNAYAWSTPVAMASALVIYSLLKRRAAGGAFTLVMSFVGGVFASLGLLVAVAKSGGFQGAMYPAFTLLIPAATVVGERVLRSSRTIAIAIMVLMVLSVGVAVTDPMMSPQRYRETGAGDVPPKMEDLLEARFMADVIPSDDITEAPVGTLLVAPYEITASFLYLSVAEGRTPYRYYTGSADLNRIVINSVVHDKALLPSRVMYIWPQRWLPDIKSHLADVPINVLYDSDRYVIFRRAPYP